MYINSNCVLLIVTELFIEHTLNTGGNVFRRVPLTSSNDGGPQLSLLYNHNLNQIEFISGITGPSIN